MKPGATILFLRFGNADPYLTHQTSIEVFVRAYKKQGFQAVVLDMSDPRFADNFATSVASPDVVAVHCEQGWGLDLMIELDGRLVDPFVHFNKPAFAHVRDYPFYPWLRSKLFARRPNRTVFYTERSAAELMTELTKTYYLGSQHHFVPHIYFDSNAPDPSIAWEDRKIDTLYVGSYSNPEEFRQKFRSAVPILSKLLDEVIDGTLDNYHEPFWRVAEGIASAGGYQLDYTRSEYLDLLVAANQFIRNERRARLLKRLARVPMYLVWAGSELPVAMHPDTRVEPANTIPETLALCDNAKSMVMCLNNFAFSLSERLLSAMHRSVAVISHSNALIDSAFVHNEDILKLSAGAENIDECIESLRDSKFAQRLTEKAKQKVEALFSPDQVVSRFVDILRRN